MPPIRRVTYVVPRSLLLPRSAKRSFAVLAGLTLMASIAMLTGQAGDRGEVPPHRRSLPPAEGRQRNRVRAPGAVGRRGHRRGARALARGRRCARLLGRSDDLTI